MRLEIDLKIRTIPRMRKYLAVLTLLAMIVGLSGCGSSHHHNKPSEASQFNDDTRVKN